MEQRESGQGSGKESFLRGEVTCLYHVLILNSYNSVGMCRWRGSSSP